MTLSREDILSASDRPIETIDVPEWGGSVNIRTLSAAERDAIETKIAREKNWTNVRAWFAVAAICDDDGEPLFTMQDIEAMGQKSAAALDRILEAVQTLNRLSDRDVEEMVGN